MAAGLGDHGQRFGRQRHPKVTGRADAALHRRSRDGPDVALDLILAGKAQWAGSDAGQDQEAQRQMRDTAIRQGGVEGRHLAPVHRRDVLLDLPRLAQKRPCLLRSLQVDRQSERRSMPQDDRQPVQRLLRRLGFPVPDRRERVADVDLVDLGHWDLAELGQDVKFDRTEPPPRGAVALQLGLARLERVPRDIAEDMQVAHRLAALPLAVLDRVDARPDKRPRHFGRPPRLGKAHRWKGAQPHLAPATVDRDPQEPLRPAVVPLVQPEPAAIRDLPRRGLFNLLERKPVDRTHCIHLSPGRIVST